MGIGLDLDFNAGWWQERTQWEYKFAWLPVRCINSDEKIWLRRAYKGTRMYTGPGSPVYNTGWLTPAEFIIHQLKNS